MNCHGCQFVCQLIKCMSSTELTSIDVAKVQVTYLDKNAYQLSFRARQQGLLPDKVSQHDKALLELRQSTYRHACYGTFKCMKEHGKCTLTDVHMREERNSLLKTGTIFLRIESL